MAVAVIATDTWLSHLQFTGPRRQSEFGTIDGVFYGVISGVGDAGGGNLTLNGNVSFERKEDWIYILRHVSMTLNSTNAQDAFIVAATGPIIPTSSAVANPSFHVGGIMQGITNNAVATFQRTDGGSDYFKDLPVFGDKKATGPLSLIAGGFETNLDGNTYQLSVEGWLIRYASFFRNTNPNLG